MMDFLTDNSKTVIELAKVEARYSGHNFIGTEHLLLGVIAIDDGVASEAFKTLDVTRECVRVEIEKLIGNGSGFVSTNPPFTPRAERVLKLAFDEAKAQILDCVDVEHILFGILKEGNGVAVRVLENLNIDLDFLRKIIYTPAMLAEIKNTEPIQIPKTPIYEEIEIPEWLKKDSPNNLKQNNEANFLSAFFKMLKLKFRPEEDGISKKI